MTQDDEMEEVDGAASSEGGRDAVFSAYPSTADTPDKKRVWVHACLCVGAARC